MTDNESSSPWGFLSFHDSVSVPKQCFVIAVTLATVLPRMPFDKPWTIGGTLSHSFRKFLMMIAVAYLVRHWGNDVIPGSVEVLMITLEGVCFSFLSLLTPYLLRKWMVDKVNIPGGRRNPGQALQPWVHLFVGLSVMFCLLNILSNDDRHTWILKKMADILSFIPVTQTLRLYNHVTTSQTSYPGRGSVLAQVVFVGEYYALFGHSADLIIRTLGLLGWIADPHVFRKTPLAQGLYANILFAGYFRVLCHSILLNILDEAYILGTGSAACNSDNAETCNSYASSSTRHRGPTVETVNDDEMAMVPIGNAAKY